MKWLYQVFGLSKQGYHQRIKRQKEKSKKEAMIIEEVETIRESLPQSGTRKVHEDLKQILPGKGIKIGRDALFNLLRRHRMLIRRTKRFHITTDSHHYYYTSPNMLKELEITHAEQVFVTDITYIKTDECHAYLALVTDAYTKKIMGWSLQNHMKVSLVKEALSMAHKNLYYRHKSIIHHSDRGKQYCCPDYTEFATKKGFTMSTTQQYDPYENAVAERINGILKYEFGLVKTLPNLQIAQKVAKQAVALYNNRRRHWSLGLKTPEAAHLQYNQHKYKSYARKVV